MRGAGRRFECFRLGSAVHIAGSRCIPAGRCARLRPLDLAGLTGGACVPPAAARVPVVASADLFTVHAMLDIGTQRCAKNPSAPAPPWRQALGASGASEADAWISAVRARLGVESAVETASLI